MNLEEKEKNFRYKLNRLLVLCLRDMKPNSKLDLSGTRYYGLSDRVKVLLLERLHGAPAPEVVNQILFIKLTLSLLHSKSNFFIVRKSVSFSIKLKKNTPTKN